MALIRVSSEFPHSALHNRKLSGIFGKKKRVGKEGEGQVSGHGKNAGQLSEAGPQQTWDQDSEI